MKEKPLDSNSFKDRLNRFHELTTDSKLEMAESLIRRGNDRRDCGLELLRKENPNLANPVAHAAAFHAYLEFPAAALDLLAWIEQSIREGEHDVHSGLTWNLMYHLYNWLQVEELIPYSASDVVEDLQEATECLRRDDAESAKAIVKALIERFEGGVSPPQVEP
jgi:hypothetical protein